MARVVLRNANQFVKFKAKSSVVDVEATRHKIVCGISTKNTPGREDAKELAIRLVPNKGEGVLERSLRLFNEDARKVETMMNAVDEEKKAKAAEDEKKKSARISRSTNEENPRAFSESDKRLVDAPKPTNRRRQVLAMIKAMSRELVKEAPFRLYGEGLGSRDRLEFTLNGIFERDVFGTEFEQGRWRMLRSGIHDFVAAFVNACAGSDVTADDMTECFAEPDGHGSFTQFDVGHFTNIVGSERVKVVADALRNVPAAVGPSGRRISVPYVA